MAQCPHDQTAVRSKLAGKSYQLRHQCLSCGEAVGPAVKRSECPFPGEWDARLQAEGERKREEHYESIRQRESRLKEESDAAWWRDYNAYLSSPRWKLKRLAVLERDGHLCTACRTRKADQVHHLTYKHLFDEPLFNLTSVRDECHEEITNLDRNRRNF